MIKLLEKDKKLIFESIRDVPNFPKKGILFKDVTTLLNNARTFNILMNHLESRYVSYNLDYVAGIDARGFIFGAVLADRLNIGFVPIRKSGKLPSETISEKYALEYGFDEVQIHCDAFCNKKKSRVLLVDDLLATGGTAAASELLINKVGANCIECCFIVELDSLKGRDKINSEIYSVLNFM